MYLITIFSKINSFIRLPYTLYIKNQFFFGGIVVLFLQFLAEF